MLAYPGGRFLVRKLHFTQNGKLWEHLNRSFCHGVNEQNVRVNEQNEQRTTCSNDSSLFVSRHFSKARPIEQIHHNKLQKDVKPGSVSSQESTFLLRVIQASHCNKVIACLHMHLMHAREMFYYISVPRMIHPWPTGQLQAAVCGKEEPSVSCKCCLSATRNSYQCANGKKKRKA